ncbi:hypothetical protein ACNQVK_00515 [Mycobacterium sp. 134]|uniref:hypothetical protein n=1 Tax=Mycobacterium sp. 134 TaxID=3400425 RepID=UPI003AADCE95
MTDIDVITTAELAETRQERANRRVIQLRSSVQTMFETLVDIYRDEDWRYVNDSQGSPYTRFTTFVEDHLSCASSYARRYQQGITGLILPLQELAAPGTRIPVTSADVARLGVTGARVVVEEAPAALEGIEDTNEQTTALRELIDSVAQRSSSPEFGPLNTAQQAEPETTGRPLGALVPSALPSINAEAQQPDDDTDDLAPDYPAPRPLAHRIDANDLPGEYFPPTASPHPEHSATAPTTSADDTSPSSATTAPTNLAEQATPTSSTAELSAAITALLQAPEPTVLAEQMPPDSSEDCLRAAQKLARLGQLLRAGS